MKKIRTLVVDDQHLVREGMVAILSVQPDIEIIGEAENGIQAVEMARKTKPDVVLLDIVMPLQDGLTTIPKLREVSPKSRILVLSSFAESSQVYQAIRTGALGYLLKDTPRAQLMQAIREVAKGQASLNPSMAVKMIHEFERPTEGNALAGEHLTQRELETLKLIARGLSNQEIAQAMVVHERTIAKYVSSILTKLHLANRTQAALYALREGLAVAAG
ncbi:MAG: response regulator transcription factor [Anaerolineales bacterium]|uniref:response regulator transcription factor n=1 Tax=Candidatus Villigracilis vicinus TaxID=3140679 RepID=UPI001B52D6E4|nr:response regulator transcription factor [Anaerolineales bacterium]MBP6179054.1 response regulator transcription factor [Anaerolineales bacterium]MBP6210905.1 response regulator transcription factor [Anaerolineales bacterium]